MENKKIFFILGRNPELSYHEVLEFLKARDRKFKEFFFKENILILEVPEDERFDVAEFGGVMHLGVVGFEGGGKDLEVYLEQNEVVPADKFSYAVHGNGDVEILKEKFKRERKKASQKHGKRLLKFQGGGKIENPKADFHIFFHENEGVVFLGIVSQNYDSSGVKNRDMNKPVRREALAISPRLSKILVNLSGAKPCDKLLDPFCGIGGVLFEALVKRINVYGIDKDKAAIEGAKKNLAWLVSEYNVKAKYSVLNADSRKADDLQFDAVATETPLGKILTKKPSDNEAKQIIRNFEAYMIPILKRLKKVKKNGARIAITFPVVRNFHVDVDGVAGKAGLEVYMRPILESRKDQFISRDILVLV